MYGVSFKSSSNGEDNNQPTKMLGRKRKNKIVNLSKANELASKTSLDYNENSSLIIPRKINFKFSHTLYGEVVKLERKESYSDQVHHLTEATLLKRNEFYSDELIDNLMGWKFPSPIGKGLRNMGNTCFLNSVLQCLLYTPPLKNYIILYKHQELCTIKGVCFMCEYSNLVKSCMSNSGGGCHTPVNILQNLRNISQFLKIGRQEDAHEFLIYMLDAIERSSKKFMEMNSNKFIIENNLNTDNLIQKVYGGVTKSSVICLKCKTPSDTFEQFLDASLEISKAETIEGCFIHYCKPENLTGDNKYLCSNCKKRNDSIKKISYEKLPRVLIVHLKRFDNFRRKIKKHINFKETLDLTRVVNQKDSQNIYKLIAVLIHEGYSTNSGHYYCYVKNSNGMWYCMNDSSVSPVSLNFILGQSPYILFYEKENDNKEFLLPLPLLHKVSDISKGVVKKDKDAIQETQLKKVNSKNSNVQELANLRKNSNSSDIAKTLNNELKLSKSNSINFLIKSKQISPLYSKKLKMLLQLSNHLKPKKNKQLNSNIDKAEKMNHSEQKVKTIFHHSNSDSNLPINSKSHLLEPIVLNKNGNTDHIEIKFNVLKGMNESEVKASHILDSNLLKTNTISTGIKTRKGSGSSKALPIPNKNGVLDGIMEKGKAIEEERIKNFYGKSNIETWEDDEIESNNQISSLIQKQLNFLNNYTDSTNYAIPEKDQYDIDYDVGKQKRVRIKKDTRKDRNHFQNYQNYGYY